MSEPRGPDSRGDSDGLLLKQYLTVLRRRWPVVVVVGLLVAIAAASTALVRGPTFEAEASVLLPSIVHEGPMAEPAPVDPAVELGTARSRAVRDLASTELGRAVRAEVVLTNGRILAIRATDATQREAAEGAVAVAEAYMQLWQEEHTRRLIGLRDAIVSQLGAEDRGAGSDSPNDLDVLDDVASGSAAPDRGDSPTLEEDLDSLGLGARVAGSPEEAEQIGAAGEEVRRLSLERELDRLQTVLFSLDESGPALLARTGSITSQGGSGVVRDGVLGLLVGLLIGAAVALALDRLGGRFVSAGALRRALGDPALLFVVGEGELRERDPDTPIPGLSTVLQVLTRRLGVNSLQITAPTAGPTLERVTERVVASLRDGGVRTAVATGDQPEDDLSDDTFALPTPRTTVALETFVGGLEGDYELVLLASPPVIPMGEAAAIATVAGATVLVVDVSETQERSLREAVGNLRSTGASVAGAVVVVPNKVVRQWRSEASSG